MNQRLLLHLTLLTAVSGFIVPATIFAAPPKPKTPPLSSPIQARTVALESPHTKWIERSLQEMQTIKVGMTREQLLKVFTEEGGISTRTWHRYVYKECPYIKVDVEFKPVGQLKQGYYESGKDVISKISQPFLEWSIMN